MTVTETEMETETETAITIAMAPATATATASPHEHETQVMVGRATKAGLETSRTANMARLDEQRHAMHRLIGKKCSTVRELYKLSMYRRSSMATKESMDAVTQ